MSNASQTDHDAFEEFFVPYGEEFYDVNCKMDDEGVNLFPFVVYEEGSRFHNVDPKEFEHVMNRGRRNSKHIETWVEKAFQDFQKHHGSLVELNNTNLLICQSRRM
jgi:hypothetical protein